jgi:endonuclease III related protein
LSKHGQRNPAQRLRRMHALLARAYGPQRWWPADTAFEVILGAYLTQNTSWKAVERSLANLREAGALSIEGLQKLSAMRLQELIRPSGFYTRKGPAIQAFMAMLDDHFGGSLEQLAQIPTHALRQRLLALPGVGFETADAILLYALGHPVPVADAYLRRIVERHRLIRSESTHNQTNYTELVQLTRDAFVVDPPSEHAQLFNEFHALVVLVGKRHCSARAKCEGCPLASDPHVSDLNSVS